MITSTLSDLARQSLAALRILLALTVLLGVVYPLAAWAAGRAVADRADGQPLTLDGVTVGSAIIGQSFTDADGAALSAWFQSRPSAAGSTGWAPGRSGSSSACSVCRAVCSGCARARR